MGMKNKELILDLLEKVAANGDLGLSTAKIAKDLYMQRTNASKLLNELVVERKVIKNDKTRPVLYSLNKETVQSESNIIFQELIGSNNFLKKAIHLAKAAVMYPNKSLNVLLIGESGAGKTTFAKRIYQYALSVKKLKNDSPYIRINCSHYTDEADVLSNKIEDSLINSMNGVLIIENCQYLDNKSKRALFKTLTDGYVIYNGKETKSNCLIICTCEKNANANIFSNELKQLFAINIELPSINEISYQDRFEFIQHFLKEEAKDSNRSIRVSHEILIALLLYNCPKNFSQLKMDIKQACASAYAREYSKNHEEISLLISDFPSYIRNGLLNYRISRTEIDKIISLNSYYVFKTNQMDVLKIKNYNSIYDWIVNKNKELKEKGFSVDEVDTIINIGLENEFKTKKEPKIVYQDNVLVDLVSPSILNDVESLLKNASKKLKRYYTKSVYIGLCMHLQAIVEKRETKKISDTKMVMNIINSCKDEYAIAENFIKDFNLKNKINLSIDEIAIVATYLRGEIRSEESLKPSILFVMHGEEVAQTLSDTIDKLSGAKTFFYNLSLNIKPLDAYGEIKKMITTIPHDKGVIVFYDMGSISDIFNMIKIETGINIKIIQIPFTLLFIDLVRKTLMSSNVDTAYQAITEKLKSTTLYIERKQSSKPKVVITFCLTGEGGAIQTKHYLEKNFNLEDVEIISLQLKEKNDFVLELNTISKEKEIIALIGTFNPDIFGIPFIPIEHVFNEKINNINDFINLNVSNNQEFINSMDTIFKHLKNELLNINSKTIEEKLIDFFYKVEEEYGEKIEINEKIGIAIHIACMINRIQEGLPSSINSNKNEIIKNNIKLYDIIASAMNDIETEYNFKISNDEIANIISIIKMSVNG